MRTKSIIKLLTLFTSIIYSCSILEEEKTPILPNVINNLSLTENEYLKKYNIKDSYDFNKKFVLKLKAKPDSIKKDYFFIPDIFLDKNYVINQINDYAQNNNLNPNNFLITILITNNSNSLGNTLFSANYASLLMENRDSVYLSNLQNLSFKSFTNNQELDQAKEITKDEYIKYLKETLYKGSPREVAGHISIHLMHYKCNSKEYPNLVYTAKNGQKCLDCGPISLQFINYSTFGTDLTRNGICDK